MNNPSDKKKEKKDAALLWVKVFNLRLLPSPHARPPKACPLLMKVDFHSSPQAGIFISLRTLKHHISSDAFLCLQLTPSQDSENPGATAQGMKVACGENCNYFTPKWSPVVLS